MSKRESLEYTSLLKTVEHLAARKDQHREPVEGNAILNVIQRRLLARIPDQDAAARAAEAHRDVFTKMRRAYAQSNSERQQAEQEGLVLRDRIKSSYPFHLDLKVFGSVAPGKIVELFKLGESDSIELGITTNKVVAGFFSFLGFPRLLSNEVVRKAIARGVQADLFGYATGRPNLGDNGRYQINWSRVAFERSGADDEIDLDFGFLIVPKALPEKTVEPSSTTSVGDQGTADTGATGEGSEDKETGGADNVQPSVGEDEPEVAFSFTAGRNDLYAAWNSLANLADVAGEVSIIAKAKPKSGFDKRKLENGVLEPLRELGLIDD